MNFSRSDRHLWLLRAHTRCPECGDTDRQFPTPTLPTARWRCGFCRAEYEHEPDNVMPPTGVRV